MVLIRVTRLEIKVPSFSNLQIYIKDSIHKVLSNHVTRELLYRWSVL